MSRSKNAARNIFWGVLQKAIVTVLPFINRTIIIYLLGDQYVGLNSLFTSVLSVLNLAELGVGSALVYSMYEPIAKGDQDKICALMKFYRKCYRIIGGIVLLCGISILPILPLLVKDELPPDINLYVLYGLYLGETVLSYFLYAYKNCLFDAHQRKDIASKVGISVSVITMVSQMLVLLVFKNYYVYVSLGLLSTIMTNIVVSRLADQRFPNYTCRGELDKESIDAIATKIKGLVTSKIGGVVINSVDNIVISVFLGLVILGWYNNYYYVMNTIIGFLNILLNSLTASIGNKTVTEGVDENYATFKRLTFLYQWIVSWCTVCLLCLYQPFMLVWNPKGMFPFYIVCLMVFRFFAGRTVQMTFTYKDALGIWWEDRWRPIVASVANLAVNIALVNIIGLEGVIISTIVSTIFINTPWGTIILFRTYFKKGLREHFLKLANNYVATIIVCLTTFAICSLVSFDGFAGLIVKFAICAIFPNMLLALLYMRTEEMKYYFRLITNRVKSIVE